MTMIFDANNGITMPDGTVQSTKGLPANGSGTPGNIAVASETLSGALTFSDGSQMATGYSLGMRNRIINGAMEIWQRGTSFTLTAATTTYVADRWYVNTAGGAGVVSQTGSVGAYSMRITGASGITSGFFGQKIESYNIADLASGTVTYTIRASSSVLTSLTWYARYPNAQDNYTSITNISNGTITINSTPTNYNFQISLPSGAANGLEVYFTFGSFTSGTLDITLAQLEKGSTATSFDYRPYGTELALCQRYYYRVTTQATFNPYGVGYNYGTTSSYIYIQFPVQMRSRPTGLEAASAGSYIIQSNGLNITPTALAIGAASSNIGCLVVASATVSNGLVAGLIDQSGSSYLGFNGAEL